MNSSKGDDDQGQWRERYRKLLDSLNIGYTLQDMADNILDVNETLLKMTGARREHLVGHNNREFYTDEEFGRLMEIALPLQEKGAYQFESVLPTVSGERIPVIYNSFINKDSDGKPESINVMTTDIRQQKKIQAELEAANRDLFKSQETLKKEKKKLETILFGIGDCVTIFDLDGNISLSNPRGVEIRGNRATPHLPLRSGSQEEIELEIEGEKHRFQGQVEAIRESDGTPFALVEILKDITDQMRLGEREQELLRIKRELGRGDLKSEMIGTSQPMQRVFDLVMRCAEVDSSILILGETGVGKEIAARAIHSRSERKGKPFVAVNCGALPDTLLESELFGHVKGAFTGAISERAGLFREAEGGVLFLDEIGDLSSPLQVKLLRALQEKEIRPVGGDRSFRIDVRVITATNKDLNELATQGHFRNDLYYRIAVIPLVIPPLRERKEDILLLAKHFIKKHWRKPKRQQPRLDHATQKLLLQHFWPGNIRELENAIEHALAMARDPVLTPDDLPVQVAMPSQADPDASAQTRLLEKSIDTEKKAISEALQRNSGNRTLAAKDLGISRTTLWRKITMYNIL